MSPLRGFVFLHIGSTNMRPLRGLHTLRFVLSPEGTACRLKTIYCLIEVPKGRHIVNTKNLAYQSPEGTAYRLKTIYCLIEAPKGRHIGTKKKTATDWPPFLI
jgi:hypothetical protein